MLTVVQEKLAEAHGLAIAAATVTVKVSEHVRDSELVRELDAMHRDADDARARCLEVERRFRPELADELLAHVNTTKERAQDLANAWFKAGTDPLRAWSFLAMGEAAEVVAWTALELLARNAGDVRVQELAGWGLPIQQRHLETALAGVAQLTELRNASAPRWG